MVIVKKQPRILVKDYITQQINLCGKSQKDIAEELNYEKPNIITMFKQGKTKVPLNKVSAFAKALGVDPLHMLRIVMSEYSPETWSALEDLLGRALISEGEMNIVSLIRQVAEGYDVIPKTDEEKDELMQLAKKWRMRDEALAAAAAPKPKETK